MDSVEEAKKMPNRRYNAGRALEYHIKKKLESQGYFVVRSAGSHGVDLVALLDHQILNPPNPDILFISCKVGEYIPPKERGDFKVMAERYGAVPLTTVKENGEWKLKDVE